MPKSQPVMSLDAVQRATHAFLKPLGFRKKGRTHNRLTDDGLTQVIGFQMGEYPVGGNDVIPGLRESLFGQFAVNLGVMLPCIYGAEHAKEPPATIQDYHCTIRERLSCLAFGKDSWLGLTPDTEALSATIVDLLDRFGLPFLGQFQSYADVLKFLAVIFMLLFGVGIFYGVARDKTRPQIPSNRPTIIQGEQAVPEQALPAVQF